VAEAEDVLVDAARHAVGFAQDLWQRHRVPGHERGPPRLPDVARRLDLLLSAAFGRGFALRTAQPPVPPTWLARWMTRDALPVRARAVPATDGASIWLPADAPAGLADAEAIEYFRVLALLQGMRALRLAPLPTLASGREEGVVDLVLLLEARACEHALQARLQGVAAQVARLRMRSLAQRPPLAAFPAPLRRLEQLARALMHAGPQAIEPVDGLPRIEALSAATPAPADVLAQARALAAHWPREPGRRAPSQALWCDDWTGDHRTPPAPAGSLPNAQPQDDAARAPIRSARLSRAPQVRQPAEGEDEREPGAWMIQTAQPHEAAEDPMGLQRPIDRDAGTAAEDFADALSELPQARLVTAPGRPREVLLSDEPPDGLRRAGSAGSAATTGALHYPEWDWRAGAYRHPGACVRLQPAAPGPQEWAAHTLATHAGMLHEVRRRFELLRARRSRLWRQLDGEAPDLDAWTEARADFRAGLPLSQRLYQHERRARRDLAIAILVDVSGSTDAWVAGQRRIVDVEREALLLVCVALEGLGDPYEVLAFSGEGPAGVVVRPVKHFAERWGPDVAQRIAGLEPEHYTRAGAALRHASASLMGQAASHRLLLLLSDGKPNDIDQYEGRYGVEDMRQAVAEARLQGISPFCLTVDRQAADYIPHIFGPQHYALLPRPEQLPAALLDWLRRLVTA